MGKVNLASSSTQFALLAKAAKPLKAAGLIANTGTFKAAANVASAVVAQKSPGTTASQAIAKPAAVVPTPTPAVASVASAAVATSAAAPITINTSVSDSIAPIVRKASALKVPTASFPSAVASMLASLGSVSTLVATTEAPIASNISPEVQKFIAWQNAQPNTFGRGTVGDLWQGDNVSVARVAQAQEMIDRESRRQAVLAGVGMSTANLFAWNKFNPGGTSIV
jgi:hypothetical protein